jgi:hypothetical protein
VSRASYRESNHDRDCDFDHDTAMRFKIVPEPPTDGDGDGGPERSGENPADDSGDVIERARRATPLVPASESECCARLLDRLRLEARDAAREWLTFGRALGFVTESDSGFRRRREEPIEEELAPTFRERVYGVREVLAVLHEADEPLSAEAVAERFGDHVPQWERYRYPDPEAIWGERARRILGWTVYFGLVERVNEGYLPAEDRSA